MPGACATCMENVKKNVIARGKVGQASVWKSTCVVSHAPWLSPTAAKMVIGLLALTSIPTVIGVGQAVGAQNRQQAACKEQQKFNLTAMMPMNGELREAAFCVLADNKVSFRPDPHTLAAHD